ncbi:hypothetical protein PIB30_025741 [Stylosanthes scabra]|uniref:Uncharacterized protein n=1 Tax=Stylosanthes scabra TaxID=79078 RepID=A0ABU6QAS6_9FABA|nr:hypothetical protein [Stylosanthes scabra]
MQISVTRNRFEEGRIDSLDLNSSKSSNFITSEPIQFIIEPIHFWAGFKVKTLNRCAFGVESTRMKNLRNEGFAKCSESTLIWGEPIHFWTVSKRLLLNRFALPSSRFSEKVNVAAYGSGRGASPTSRLPTYVYDRGRLIGPPGKYERWSSSASSGSVGLGYYNRPDELILACRI